MSAATTPGPDVPARPYAEAIDEVTAAAKATADAHRRLDAAMRAARDAGAPLRTIAAAAGTTHVTVQRIVTGQASSRPVG